MGGPGDGAALRASGWPRGASAPAGQGDRLRHQIAGSRGHTLKNLALGPRSGCGARLRAQRHACHQQCHACYHGQPAMTAQIFGVEEAEAERGMSPWWRRRRERRSSVAVARVGHVWRMRKPAGMEEFEVVTMRYPVVRSP